MLHIRTILHPTDFSETAQEALQVAQRLALDHGAKLILLHVAKEVPSLLSGFSPTPRVTANGRRLQALAESVIGMTVEVELLEGNVGSNIVAAAERWTADLIVIGRHGESGVGRFLIGSVAERVVKYAPCAVLVVKPGSAWILTQPENADTCAPRPHVLTART